MATTDAAVRRGGTPTPDSPAPQVLALSDARAADPRLAGAKAANLARAMTAGLPVLPGFVITTHGTSALDSWHRTLLRGPDQSLYLDWRALSNDGARELAVRSSSVLEDSTTSSMAGRFLSVLHVKGWKQFVDAVYAVIESAASSEIADAPMAVLIQPMAEAAAGGVLFGLNPLTGVRSELLVSVVTGTPDQIVSGEVTGTTMVLGRHGRIRSVRGTPVLRPAQARALARLSGAAGRAFGGPQDIEWLIESDGTLRLLQSRPITASAVPPERSHAFGPGPVAETFPDALSRLERDLWVPPLETGIREALQISGAVSRRALHQQLVVDINGRVALDLESLGIVARRRSRLGRLLDPRPGLRRLRAAWRVGRLRYAMPAISADLAADIDAHLSDVPRLSELDDDDLLAILRNSTSILAGLHAHEVLAGLLLPADAAAATSAAVASATLARDRLDGRTDEEIIARHPVTLALVPPRIGDRTSLPAMAFAPAMPTATREDEAAIAREALRLRIRWVQELTVQTAREIGARLRRRGQVRTASDVRELSWSRLEELVRMPGVTETIAATDTDPPALPQVFRLAVDGTVVPDPSTGASGEAIGVSAGRVRARVTHDPVNAVGAVLVVDALRPDLAATLPQIAGLVARAGSPLSHLAILAREQHIPAVVGVSDDFADGQVVIVDGGAGTVEVSS